MRVAASTIECLEAQGWSSQDMKIIRKRKNEFGGYFP